MFENDKDKVTEEEWEEWLKFINHYEEKRMERREKIKKFFCKILKKRENK